MLNNITLTGEQYSAMREALIVAEVAYGVAIRAQSNAAHAFLKSDAAALVKVIEQTRPNKVIVLPPSR